MRLIDADALEADLKKQFDMVFTEAGRKVKPEDYFIERHATWYANVVKAEQDSFFDYLKSRPTIDSEPVLHASLKETGMDEAWCPWGDCTNCGESNIMGSTYCNKCGAKLDLEAAYE